MKLAGLPIYSADGFYRNDRSQIAVEAFLYAGHAADPLSKEAQHGRNQMAAAAQYR
jgi:hypothetical protein